MPIINSGGESCSTPCTRRPRVLSVIHLRFVRFSRAQTTATMPIGDCCVFGVIQGLS